MKKDTAELLEELKKFSDFKSFYSDNIKDVTQTRLSDYLNGLIEEKNLSKADVISKSGISEIYAYQILSGVRKAPSRNKVLSLAFGMGLTFEETQRMLMETGYAQLYIKNPFDCVVIYGLCKRLSVIDVNDMLYDYGQELLW